MDLVEFAQKGEVKAAQSQNLSTKKLFEYKSSSYVILNLFQLQYPFIY